MFGKLPVPVTAPIQELKERGQRTLKGSCSKSFSGIHRRRERAARKL